MIIIPLSINGKKYKGKYEAIVDDEDADLAELRWHPMGGYQGEQYAYTSVVLEDGRGKQVAMHRIIMNRILGRPLKPREYVDHINRQPRDNRRENLRIATPAQNAQNQIKPKNRTGFTGVFYQKSRNRYRATISNKGKRIFLGSFKTAEEAYQAYCDAADELHGEFANYKPLKDAIQEKETQVEKPEKKWRRLF